MLKFYWLTGSGEPRYITVPNFVEIGQSVVEILRFFDFLDGGYLSSLICLGRIWNTHEEYFYPFVEKAPHGWISTKFYTGVVVADMITRANCFDDQLSDVDSVWG